MSKGMTPEEAIEIIKEIRRKQDYLNAPDNPTALTMGENAIYNIQLFRNTGQISPHFRLKGETKQ